MSARGYAATRYFPILRFKYCFLLAARKWNSLFPPFPLRVFFKTVLDLGGLNRTCLKSKNRIYRVAA